ncbi:MULTISPECIES: hypothetical protein [Pseudomonas]|uniref:Uncharacterized protein n=1 Tax=Pseudomonas quercus TaxID=2722792 RepID=A0ABX0YE13_9PSED|nr:MULTISPECIES: hypothetical protein [Pseudomonas]MBF7142627.1 hypothetical protein [Pseudomonas sp. LY10J]NJP01165.1 hypothetical protein [Pseudomonas quercus]
MEPIRRGIAHNTQATSANPAQGAPAAIEAHPSGHDSSLTAQMLSNHSVNELNAKERQGTENEKALAQVAKYALESGQLKISPKQPAVFFNLGCNVIKKLW